MLKHDFAGFKACIKNEFLPLIFKNIVILALTAVLEHWRISLPIIMSPGMIFIFVRILLVKWFFIESFKYVYVRII